MDQIEHNNHLNTTTILLKPLSIDETNNIFSWPHAGQSAREVSRSGGRDLATTSRIHQEHSSILTKAIGGRPPKLTSTNIHHASCLIGTKKADNAVQV